MPAALVAEQQAEWDIYCQRDIDLSTAHSACSVFPPAVPDIMEWKIKQQTAGASARRPPRLFCAVSIRVGQAPIRDVRRADCHRISWPLSKFKTDEIVDRLKALWRWGARKVKIIGDTETMDVELGPDGSCQEDS